MRKAPFVVSLASDLRPLVVRLNVELARRRAKPVAKNELPAIDTLLEVSITSADEAGDRCWRCDGYVGEDGAGEQNCLNCGRPAGRSLLLGEVVTEIAQGLIDRRREARR